MVITAYTLPECQSDYEVIQDALFSDGGNAEDAEARTPRNGISADIAWEPELNPFGSQVIRDTKSKKNKQDEYRENSAWQAWYFG